MNIEIRMNFFKTKIRVVQKNKILRYPIAFSFFKRLCRKKDSREGCGLYDDI